ncbi:MAG: SRPBCC family protein [Acidimicrobiia bacterium]|nr:SRPBCC family protein [Acidimicrobiia bacterium]
MALNSVILPIDPQRLFDEYLLHPETYPIWLVGADEIRAIDETWPAPGSRFHHTVGLWPLHLKDYTESVQVDSPHTFRLLVKARPLVRALVTFTVHGTDDESILAVEEHPQFGPADIVLQPLTDPLIHLRNQASLRRLAALIAERHDAASS